MIAKIVGNRLSPWNWRCSTPPIFFIMVDGRYAEAFLSRAHAARWLKANGYVKVIGDTNLWKKTG